MSVRPFTSPILALVGVIAGGIRAAAQAVEGRSAGNLVQACKAEQGDASGWCSADLLGVADTLTTTEATDNWLAVTPSKPAHTGRKAMLG